MPVFRRDGQEVLFIHVPKTGGTSVERMFETAGFTMLYRDGKTGAGSVNNLRTCSPQHMHAAMLEQTFRLERFDLIFMVAREPLARFRSEYAHRNARDCRTDAASVTAWAERVLRRYRADRYALDNHLRPQHEFYVPGTTVYRLEDGLDSIMRDLDAKVGGGLPQESLRALDRQRTTGVSSSAVELSDELQRSLTTMYHADFARFGYRMPAG